MLAIVCGTCLDDDAFEARQQMRVHLRHSNFTFQCYLICSLLFLVCVSLIIIGQPQNSVLVRRV